MFCLALLEAWCFPISALKALGLLPKEARRLEWYGIATPNTKCWGNYPPLPNPLKILPANQNHFLKTYEFGNIIHFIHTVDGKNPCNHLGCPKCWWHPMVGHPSLGTYQVGAKWLPLVGWRYPASQKQSPKKKLHKLVGGWIDSKKISAKRLDLNNHLRCHLVVGQLTLSKTLPEWMCVCVWVCTWDPFVVPAIDYWALPASKSWMMIQRLMSLGSRSAAVYLSLWLWGCMPLIT